MATIQSYVTPQRLYRYRSLENFDREIKAIEQGYLYCSRFEDLNDPMEGLFSSSQMLRKSENYRAIKDAIVDRKANTGMCSFSEVYDHELMWAHYANQFEGICIAYRLSHLLEKLEHNVSFVRIYYNEVVPTVYRENRSPSLLAKMVLSNKNYRWLYEREWRMFASPGKTYYHRTNCVSRVYIGSRMAPGHRESIRSRLKRLKINVREMIIDEYFINLRDKARF